jgi:hypothetical protein
MRDRIGMTQLGFLFVLLASGPDALAKSAWKQVAKEDGITVSAREVPGRGFPTFRGVGFVGANLFDVLAVMSDVPRHTKWMDRCTDSRLLRKISETEYVTYSRTDLPWPVSDRDAVFRSKVVPRPSKLEVVIKFWAVGSRRMGEVKGVVRMKRLRGHYKLWALAPNITRVEYQVDADPGGLLPRWLAKIGTRRLPLHTIRNLRKQVTRTRGWYAARIARWKGGGWR